MQAILRRTSASYAISRATKRSFARTALTKPQAQQAPAPFRPLAYYYHLPEGQGSIYTFPHIVTTGTFLERLWHGCNNFEHEVHAIGTHGCKFCACVYIRLNETQCFAAHLKAYIHVHRWNKDRKAWIPTSEEGESLMNFVASQLRRWLVLQRCDLRNFDRERSLMVCPDTIYEGERSTGFYLCQAVREVFGDIPDQGTGVHGFVVDHIQGHQILLPRGPEVDMLEHLVERSPEDFGFTRRNEYECNEDEVGTDWSFMLHRGEWKTTLVYMAEMRDPRYAWKQQAAGGSARLPFL